MYYSVPCLHPWEFASQRTKGLKTSVLPMNDLHSTQCPEPDIFDLYDDLERFIMSAYLCQGSCQDDSCRRGPGESVNCFNQHASLENRQVST